MMHDVPYTVKLSSGKTFAVVHKIHYSLENFRNASGRGHHVLYTASDSREKFSKSAENCKSFPTRSLCRIRTIRLSEYSHASEDITTQHGNDIIN